MNERIDVFFRNLMKNIIEYLSLPVVKRLIIGNNNRKSNNLVLILILELIIALSGSFFTYSYYLQKYPTFNLTHEVISNRYLNATSYDLQIDNTKLSCKIGKDSASIKLYYFFDYSCPYCQKVSQSIDYIINLYPEEVQVFYIPFPLNSECNPLTTYNKANSCILAKVSLLSGQRNIFGEVYNEIRKNNLQNNNKLLESGIDDLGILNIDTLKSFDDLNYENTYEYIIANEVDISAIPVLLINKKKIVGNIHPTLLKFIIEENLKSNYNL